MTPSPALGFLEIYGHYFKSSEGGIDGRTLRGFHAASVLEFIDKYLGINDAETADFLKQHLNGGPKMAGTDAMARTMARAKRAT